jgi:phage terminase large subunit
VRATLRKSVFKLFEDLVEMYGWDSVFKFYRSDFTIKCVCSGSDIWCVGLDDREKIKSITGITSIWNEEVTELSEEDFDQLDLRMRGETPHYKQIISTFNPISPSHWIKNRFWGKGQVEEKEIERREIEVSVPGEGKVVLPSTLVTTGYRHNKHLDLLYKAKLEALRDVNPEYYRVYALGHWGVLNSVIYAQPKLVTDAEWTQLRFSDTFYGLDFGFTDPTVLVEVNLVDNNKSEVFEREIIYETGLTTAEIANRTKQYLELRHGSGWKHIIVYADGAEPDRIKELRAAGINIRPANKAKNSIVDGILFCKTLRVFLHEDSHNMLREYSSYCWDSDRDGQLKDYPVDFNNHSMDAKRYAEYSHLWAGGKTGYVGASVKVY